MTTKDDALIEAMAKAMNPECFEQDVVATYGDLWALRQQDKQKHFARLALAVARKAILEEAAQVAHNCGQYSEAYLDPNERPLPVDIHNRAVWRVRDAIRALANKEQS